MEVLLEVRKLKNKNITTSILNEIVKLCKKNGLSILQSGDTIKVVKEWYKMKILEDYINRNKENEFYCEVIMKYSSMTEEVRKLAKLINEAHKKAFSVEDGYKTAYIAESDSTTFRTIEG